MAALRFPFSGLCCGMPASCHCSHNFPQKFFFYLECQVRIQDSGQSRGQTPTKCNFGLSVSCSTSNSIFCHFLLETAYSVPQSILFENFVTLSILSHNLRSKILKKNHRHEQQKRKLTKKNCCGTVPQMHLPAEGKRCFCSYIYSTYENWGFLVENYQLCKKFGQERATQ